MVHVSGLELGKEKKMKLVKCSSGPHTAKQIISRGKSLRNDDSDGNNSVTKK